MRLSELQHSGEFGQAFGPTEKFSKIYGNFCGKGNRGGNPIDDLDKACHDHDECYHYRGRDNCDCDQKFKDELNRLSKTKLTVKQKLAIAAFKLYLHRRCKNKR